MDLLKVSNRQYVSLEVRLETEMPTSRMDRKKGQGMSLKFNSLHGIHLIRREGSSWNLPWTATSVMSVIEASKTPLKDTVAPKNPSRASTSPLMSVIAIPEILLRPTTDLPNRREASKKSSMLLLRSTIHRRSVALLFLAKTRLVEKFLIDSNNYLESQRPQTNHAHARDQTDGRESLAIMIKTKMTGPKYPKERSKNNASERERRKRLLLRHRLLCRLSSASQT